MHTFRDIKAIKDLLDFIRRKVTVHSDCQLPMLGVDIRSRVNLATFPLPACHVDFHAVLRRIVTDVDIVGIKLVWIFVR